MNIGYGVLDHPIHKARTWIPLEIEEFRRRGHHVVPIARGRENELRQEIRNLDFIVCHFSKRAMQIRRLGVPFGIISHARGIWINNGEWLKGASIHPKCKWVGYISNYHKDIYNKWGIDKPLIHTPVSINTELFKRTKPIGDKVLCGARHIAKKGLDIAIKAYPNIYCWGEGPLTSKLKTISNKTTFTGWLSNDELIELMNDSWLYVFPGIKLPNGDMDGQPTTIKEAMAMELQIISTPIAGTAELPHIHFVNADVNEVRDKIQSIKHESNISGRDYVLKNFHPSIIVDNILEAIE